MCLDQRIAHHTSVPHTYRISEIAVSRASGHPAIQPSTLLPRFGLCGSGSGGKKEAKLGSNLVRVDLPLSIPGGGASGVVIIGHKKQVMHSPAM